MYCTQHTINDKHHISDCNMNTAHYAFFTISVQGTFPPSLWALSYHSVVTPTLSNLPSAAQATANASSSSTVKLELNNWLLSNIVYSMQCNV